jgi:hypothetical protein
MGRAAHHPPTFWAHIDGAAYWVPASNGLRETCPVWDRNGFGEIS